MKTSACILAMAMAVPFSMFAGEPVSKRYRALAVPAPKSGSTWAILDRDGANRQVAPYLSSLGGGETGTGAILSPPFALAADRIEFTICGHDGMGGGARKNFLALIDAGTGEALRKTLAPGSDPMTPQSWDVKDLKGRRVRLEACDGLAAGAFAWLGIGRIDAGPEMRVDFKDGLPRGWESRAPAADPEKEKALRVAGAGVPFRDEGNTIVPGSGALSIPCGFEAKRLFFLGCTVEYGRPPDVRGEIRIVYKEGPAEQFPLILGFTLECENKLPSKSRALHLRSAGEPFLHYLAIAPRPGAIERIEIRRDPAHAGAVSIRGITAETAAGAATLKDLPDRQPGAEEAAWIESRAISAERPKVSEVIAELKRLNKQ